MKHPMIEAIGIDEFKKLRKSLPKYAKDNKKGNFKPIAIELIWQTQDTPINTGSREEAMFMFAVLMQVWEQKGWTIQKTVKDFLKNVTTN